MSRRVVWCLLVVAVGGAVVGAIVASRLARPAEAADPPGYAKVLDVQALRLVDEEGNLRAALFMLKGCPCLMMWRGPEKLALQMSVNEQGSPCVILHDRSGTPRLGMALVNGEPRMELAGSDGKVRCQLAEGANGIAALRLFDDSGSLNATAALAAGKKGSGQLMFFDKGGKPLWSAP